MGTNKALVLMLSFEIVIFENGTSRGKKGIHGN